MATAADRQRLQDAMTMCVTPGMLWDNNNPVKWAFDDAGIQGFEHHLVPCKKLHSSISKTQLHLHQVELDECHYHHSAHCESNWRSHSTITCRASWRHPHFAIHHIQVALTLHPGCFATALIIMRGTFKTLPSSSNKPISCETIEQTQSMLCNSSHPGYFELASRLLWPNI